MPKKAGKLTIFKEENTMTATLTLNDLTIEQASAVLTLLEEIKGSDTVTPEMAREGMPLFEEPAPAAVQAAAPVQTAPVPTTTPAPVQPAPIPAAPVVDAAYRARVCTAAAGLIDRGKMPDVLAALASFGVQAVTQLSAEQLPAFANKITALGGVI